MHVCECPHCKSQNRVRGGAKKHKCKACGGFFGSIISGVKKLASNPIVQSLAKAAAPHAMKALQKHAPGLGALANRAVGVAQRVASNPTVQRLASNPMVQNLARAAAPHAAQALQRHAPGLVSAAERVAAQPLAQRGLADLRARVGLGTKKGQMRKTARKAYESESESDEEKEGGRKHCTKCGGLALGALMPFAGQAIGAIPGASEALGPFGALLGVPQQAPPPPPPPRASFQGIQGYVPPQIAARPGVMGRGRKTRPPTKHALAVKEVMKTMGMGLPQASRYVKEKGLAM
jgi:hypothetical protein